MGDWLNDNAAAIQAISSVMMLMATGLVIWWARRQANAQRDAADATQEAIRAAQRPIVMPRGLTLAKERVVELVNLGPGAALNLVVRLWAEDKFSEGTASFLGHEPEPRKLALDTQGGLTWIPNYKGNSLIEILYEDVFGRLHRTHARMVNWKWVDVQCDNVGRPHDSKFFLLGTKYNPDLYTPDGNLRPSALGYSTPKPSFLARLRSRFKRQRMGERGNLYDPMGPQV